MSTSQARHDEVSHNLPTPLTTFVGRAAELRSIAAALGEARVVTVAGPGGCGKTRLAVEAAGGAAGRWADGVCWVDLAATGDPSVVPDLLAEAVGALHGAAGRAGPSPAQQLGDRRMLVCLDNCEHLLAAAAEVAVDLVSRCPYVTVLATSREPLGVAGELVWRVPSLSGDDAIALFDERSGPSVPSSEQARTAVRTTCARLDGIPLAVELAAAWSGTLSAQEILRGLDDRFSLLIRGPRGVAARHQTLAASMAWSHDLLDEPDRVLFRRLAVFHSGFTLRTAQAVCAFDPLDELSVLAGLRRLVEKSLVIADTQGSEARYRMLETIGQYAAARLAASGEQRLVRDRHLEACLALAQAAVPLLAENKDAWRAAIEMEQENLRAAIEWGLSLDDPERGRALAAELPWLWHLNRRGHEGLDLLRQAVERAPAARTALQARLLTGLTLVADTTRPLGPEHDAAQSALDIATETGDAATACLARLLTGVAIFHEDFDTGWSLAEAAREQALSAGETFVVDGATALLGMIEHLRDAHGEALRLLGEAVAGLVRRGDRGVASTALGFMALSALYTGDLARARDLAAEGVRTARPLADYHRVGSAAAVVATVESYAGRFDEARTALAPIIRLVEGADAPPFIPGLARAGGYLHLWTGQPEQAIAWFRRESDWIEGGGEVDLTPQTLTGLAAAFRATGDAAAAATACERALAAARHAGMRRVVADALEQSALLATDPVRAEDLHHEALSIRAEHELWLPCVESLEALAAVAAHAESYIEAVRLLAACDHARHELGYPRRSAPDLVRLRNALGPEAYESAWRAGSELAIPDAVAYAQRARGKRGRPSSGWASLTPTEQSVVRLAVKGLSNPAIGSELFMSRSTVKTHLSHVYAKLGVTNRTELATAAAPHLSTPPP
jgi:predicted ATPase/DNA-binding NarL/FixJ family response regulator